MCIFCLRIFFISDRITLPNMRMGMHLRKPMTYIYDDKKCVLPPGQFICKLNSLVYEHKTK